MTETCTVSVLIPLYNGIEFLNECLESLKEQTCQDFEVLIGINGHPKGSDVFIEAVQYANDKIKVIEYDEIGKANTLNKMIHDTSTDIICILDVDDLWLETKLEEQLSVFLLHQYDVIGTRAKYFGDRDYEPQIPVGKIKKGAFLEQNVIINSSVMLRKKLCQWKHGVLDDYELWLRLEYEGYTFYNIDKVLCLHRISEHSAFNNFNFLYVEGLIAEYKKKYESYITVVSSFYTRKSEYPKNYYERWIKYFLNTPMFLVIFTDKESSRMISDVRRETTEIIVLEMDDFVVKKHQKHFDDSYIVDPERYHSPESYMVEAEKIFFLQRARLLNRFQSKWFFWMDIEICRYGNIPLSFPNYTKVFSFPENRVLCFSHEIIDEQDHTVDHETGVPVMYSKENICRFQSLSIFDSLFFAIPIVMMDTFVEMYRETLLSFISHDVFLGRPGFFMHTMYLKHRDFFHLVESRSVSYLDMFN